MLCEPDHSARSRSQFAFSASSTQTHIPERIPAFGVCQLGKADSSARRGPRDAAHSERRGSLFSWISPPERTWGILSSFSQKSWFFILISVLYRLVTTLRCTVPSVPEILKQTMETADIMSYFFPGDKLYQSFLEFFSSKDQKQNF